MEALLALVLSLQVGLATAAVLIYRVAYMELQQTTQNLELARHQLLKARAEQQELADSVAAVRQDVNVLKAGRLAR